MPPTLREIDNSRRAQYRREERYYQRDLPMKTISLKLPDDLERELAAKAERDGTTKSAVIREAIEAHLSRDASRPKGSFLELAGDLIGCLEGPGDLSYNKDHFKDFGRR
jgi:hypothetical protein